MHRRVVVIASIFLGSLLILAGARPALAVVDQCGGLFFAGDQLAKGAADYNFGQVCTYDVNQYIGPPPVWARFTIEMRGHWDALHKWATEEIDILGFDPNYGYGPSTRKRPCSEDPWLAPDPSVVCGAGRAGLDDSLTGFFLNEFGDNPPFPQSGGGLSSALKQEIKAKWLVLNPQTVLSRGVPPMPPTVQAVEPRIFYKHPKEGTGSVRATTGGAAAGHVDVRINFSGSIPTAAAYRVDGEGWWVGVGPPEVVRDTALVKIPTTVFQESQHTVEVRLSNAVGGSAGTVLIEEHPPQGTRGSVDLHPPQTTRESVDLHVNPSMQGDLPGAPAGRRNPQGTIQRAPTIEDPIRGAIRPKP